MTDSGEHQLPEQVRAYLDTHPEVSPVAVLGRFDSLDAREDADRQAIARYLGIDIDGDADSGAEGGGDESRAPTAETATPTMASSGEWANAAFDSPEPGVYPPELDARERWMAAAGKTGKQPFAPWGDRDHPEADPGADARWKWGLSENYADGPTVDEWVRKDPRLDGRTFILTDDGPYAFVDGDDVRDPETGAVHPAFRAILERLGLTYADISTSGSGVHAYYRAPEGLPISGKGQASFEIDTEPWGANDSPPTVELYANKHVCVATGEHVPGTPLEIADWNSNALQAILEAHGYSDAAPESGALSHDSDRERADLDDYEPTATRHDETTTEVRDVLAAVDRLAPRDLPLTTTQTGEDSTGWSTWDPSYRVSESGASLHYNGEGAFYDHKEGESFGVLGLFAAEQGITTEPWDRLNGADWWAAIDAAREQGAPIPRYDGARRNGDSEPVTVLPPAVRDLSTATTGFDWRHAARAGTATLTVEDARERTRTAIGDAYRTGDRVLIEALPTMGKTYGAVAAAADTGTQVTIVTGRGRKEQYAQLREWCDEHGLTSYTLPAFLRDCPTAAGEHGEEWQRRVRDLYNRGVSPREIHRRAEHVFGQPLPCQCHDGQRCPYAAKWDFNPDDIDVLIGHYTHLHKPKVVSGRTVVIDEFAEAYETSLGPRLEGAVSYWLEATEEIPFRNYTDLIENRDDQARRADALLWFNDHGVGADEGHVFDDHRAHALAPLAVFTILAGENLDNGWERAALNRDGGGAVGLFTDGRDYAARSARVHLLQPPQLRYASGVVALDGTPTHRMWELALGERLTHRRILQPGEREEYIRDVLNLNLVRSTEYIKPYNSADHVTVARDAALLEAIADEHDSKPALITTATAERVYKEAGLLESVDETKHYGNVLGSNEFENTRLGVVIGSNHYGDGYIKKWGAYAGEGTDRDGDGKGVDLEYSGFGQRVLTHMREHDTLQAAMRFGRDGGGAVVYVHTDTLPDWVPIVGEARVLSTRSDGERSVIAALEQLGIATTAELVGHPVVDLSRQQVFRHLERLRERGVLTREQDPEDGRRVRWRDEGVARLGEHGDVEIGKLEINDLDEAEVRQLARSTTYTWELTNVSAEGRKRMGDLPACPPERPHGAITRGGPPPDVGD